MSFESLTRKSIWARPVVLKLKQPLVARIATFAEWPLILIDRYTEEAVIVRSYFEPYIRRSMRYLIRDRPTGWHPNFSVIFHDFWANVRVRVVGTGGSGAPAQW